MRRLRAFLRLLRIRETRSRRVIEIAGRSFIERRTRPGVLFDSHAGDFSEAWLARTRAAR